MSIQRIDRSREAVQQGVPPALSDGCRDVRPRDERGEVAQQRSRPIRRRSRPARMPVAMPRRASSSSYARSSSAQRIRNAPAPSTSRLGLPRLHAVHHVVDRAQQRHRRRVVIAVAVAAERQPMVDAPVGEVDHVGAVRHGARAPGTRGVTVGPLDPLRGIRVRQVLDPDRRVGRHLHDAIGVDVDAAVHKRAERDGALAEEPEVVLGPVIGIGIERAKDPVTKRQCHRVGSVVRAQSVQISDRLRAQHLVIVQEHDPVVPALRPARSHVSPPPSATRVP